MSSYQIIQINPAETALTNTKLEEAFYVVISNIKSFSRDSVNQHNTRESMYFKSSYQ
jgi:hypothetical protein